MSIDTAQFLSMTTDEALDTKITPCPPGEWQAMIGDIEIADYQRKDGTTGYRLVVPWEIQDEGVKSELGRDTVKVTDSIFLDMNADGTALDMSKGKNIGLGRLREALGQNTPGEPWGPAMLQGQVAVVEVVHEVYKGNPVANIKAVRAI